MRKKIAKLTLRAAFRAGGSAVICFFSDVGLIGCTLGFTLAIAGYFGHEPFDWQPYALLSSIDKPAAYLVGAFFLSVCAILFKILHSLMIAKITVAQELWYAQRLRRLRVAGLKATTISRASNHYGRLAASSVRMYSSTMLILISMFLGVFLASGYVRAFVLCVLLIACIFCIVIFAYLSNIMSSTSQDLVKHGRHMALWKSGSIKGSGEVRKYASAYFLRIFLPGIFGIAPMVFAASLTVFLFVLYMNSIEVNLASMFVGFMMTQAYLGLLARAFDEGLKISAFVSAVTLVWDTFDIKSE